MKLRYYHHKPLGYTSEVVIVSCAIQYDGALLFLKRSYNKNYGGKWCLPGGKVEKKESLIDATIREVKEETSINLKGFKIEKKNRYYIDNIFGSYQLYIFKSILKKKPSVILNQEHSQFIWVTPDMLESIELIPGSLEFLKTVIL